MVRQIEDIKKELEVFKYINFEEEGHKYFGHDAAQMTSVSKFKSWCKQPFNTEFISKMVAIKRGVTQESILEEWDKKRLWGTTRGSAVHKFIENYYLDVKEDVVLDDWVMSLSDVDLKLYLSQLETCKSFFYKFLEDFPHLEPIATEVVVGDPDYLMAGTFDQLFYNTITNKVELWDWKTDSNLRLKERNKLKNSFKKFKATNINVYTIQLNTYKHFLNKYTNLDVQTLNIMHMNADNDSYVIYNLENWDELIKEGLNEYSKNNIAA